jgi:two-component system cell cycle sensor histidine kinase/response regulator CckA
LFGSTKPDGAATTCDAHNDVLARLFFDAPHPSLALDVEGRILALNGSFARLVGLEPDAIVGRLLASLCVSDEPESDAIARMAAVLGEVREGRVVQALEHRYARPNGSVAWCRLTLGPVRDADGALAYALVSIEDFSSSVSAQESLLESEERFRTLVELSPDPVFFFVRGVVEHANPAAARLLGASDVSEVLGRKSTELVHPDCVPEIALRASALMRGESVPAIEERWIRFDGTLVDVETNVSRIPLAVGAAFVVIVRDIRERKDIAERSRKEREARAASHEAKEREQWLRQIIDLLPTCVYARDAQGTFVLANRAFAEIVGAEPRDVVGRTLEELGVPTAIAEAMRKQDRTVLASGEPSLLSDEVFVDKSGRRRVVETNRVAFSLRERATVLCASADVTDKRRLETELLEAQKLDAIGRLAGGIAHDFNNLLTVLVTSADELAMRSEVPHPDVERIHEVASRATALTQQLLAFARKSPVEARVVAINDLVHDVVRLLARVLGENIVVKTVLDPNAKEVLVDRSKIERVLVNLAVNARDAMVQGGTLTISTRNTPALDASEPDWVAVSVIDTGLGMSAETRAHVFEPFFTTKAVGKGTGLGLATCFGIVQQLGGRIEVESELEHGTTFRLLLPAMTGSRRYSRHPASPPRGNETVLVIDDDAQVLNATARVLKQLGYSVLAASSPEEGLEIATSYQDAIAVLLTDIMMPGKSGPETAREIRLIRPDVRVLFMSGYSGDILAVAGEEVLSKPYSRQEMATRLREVLAAPPRKL